MTAAAKYLFYIFPLYMIYVLATHKQPDWGFSFLWLLEVLVIQTVVSAVIFGVMWLAKNNQLATLRKSCIYAFIASTAAVLLAFIF